MPEPSSAPRTTDRLSRRRNKRPGRSRPPRRQASILHPLAALLNLSQRQPSADASGSRQRRQRQRLAMAQRLLDPLPQALINPATVHDRFWTVLRWGGLGLIAAKLLQR